jgi:hypothetical protein
MTKASASSGTVAGGASSGGFGGWVDGLSNLKTCLDRQAERLAALEEHYAADPESAVQDTRTVPAEAITAMADLTGRFSALEALSQDVASAGQSRLEVVTARLSEVEDKLEGLTASWRVAATSRSGFDRIPHHLAGLITLHVGVIIVSVIAHDACRSISRAASRATSARATREEAPHLQAQPAVAEVSQRWPSIRLWHLQQHQNGCD